MRAAIFTGVDRPLTIADVELMPPGPHDVVVRVTASGVCHSDLSILHGHVPRSTPSVLGHEGAGIVTEVGAAVTSLRPGDRVIGAFVPVCGACSWCHRGETHLCLQQATVGRVPRFRTGNGEEGTAMAGLGTFAEAMTVAETSLVRVETDLADEQLALIGCGYTTGVGAVLNTAGVTAGATMAVLGCGGVGQAAIQGGRVAGAARIIAVDPVAMKRDQALKLGATDAIDPAAGDPVEAVRELTGGLGVDYAFEVTGVPAVVAQAFAMARRGGTAVAVGMPRHDAVISLSPFELFSAEKRLQGCFYGSAQVRRDFPRLIRLVEAGRLDIAASVSHHMDLADVNAALDLLQAGEAIRTILTLEASPCSS